VATSHRPIDRYSGRVSVDGLLLLEGEEGEGDGEGREQKECEDIDTVLMRRVEESLEETWKERTNEWRRKKDDNALKRWIWGGDC
jgi:hypothetical protein